MEIFFKAVAAALIAAVLVLALGKGEKEFAAMLSLFACCVLALAAVSYLEPVVGFFEELRELGQLDGQMLTILIKSVGIGIVAELAALVCADAGNAALGRAVELLACAVVLWMSIPLFQSLLDLIQGILGGV